MIETGQTGTALFPLPAVRVAGGAELLAAIGLIAPQATGLAEPLTPTAALGLCVIMVCAAWSHTKLHEPRNVLVNIVLFTTCVVVAVGRFTT
jgi:hypothetical protein